MEDSADSDSIPYLDTLISVDKDGQLSTELFIKAQPLGNHNSLLIGTADGNEESCHYK